MEQVKKVLEQAIGLKMEISALESERLVLRSMAEKATRASFRQGRPRGGQSRVEVGALDLLRLEEQLGDMQKQYLEMYGVISSTISKVEDPTARAILRLRYLYGAPWKEICSRVSYSWAGAHYKHNRALLEMKEGLSQLPHS